MKNIYVLILSLCAMMLVTSCLTEDEMETTPECFIASLRVGDIATDIPTKLSDGTDTIITKTIDGNDVYFNINQLTGDITAVDSLPEWVNLSRVVPTFTYTGAGIFIQRDSLYYRFINGSDSLDFSKPANILVIASDGYSAKRYTVKINKRKGEVDSLAWAKPVGLDLQLEGKHRTVVLADRMYVFAENGETPTVTSSSFLSEGASWRKPATLKCEKGLIDWQSVTVFGGKMYALTTDGVLCETTNEERGENWTPVETSAETFVRLLSADNNYLYAFDGEKIVGTKDLSEWMECGSADMNMLPETCVFSTYYTSRTNYSMSNVVMGGLNGNNDKNAVIWYKVSSADPIMDQAWNYVQVTGENEYGCPKLANFSMTFFNDELYAIGGEYEGLYTSADNGISWRLVEEKRMLPDDFDRQSGKPASLVAGNGCLWIIQSGGNVWCGKMG